jgi:hypothetical protein
MLHDSSKQLVALAAASARRVTSSSIFQSSTKSFNFDTDFNLSNIHVKKKKVTILTKSFDQTMCKLRKNMLLFWQNRFQSHFTVHSVVQMCYLHTDLMFNINIQYKEFAIAEHQYSLFCSSNSTKFSYTNIILNYHI